MWVLSAVLAGTLLFHLDDKSRLTKHSVYELYPERPSIPENVSTWKPKNIAFAVVPNTRVISVTENRSFSANVLPKEKSVYLVWKDNEVVSKSDDFTDLKLDGTVVKAAFNKRNRREGEQNISVGGKFEYFYESDSRSVYVVDEPTRVDKKIAEIDDRYAINPLSTGYYLSRYDEFVYPIHHANSVDLVRICGTQPAVSLLKLQTNELVYLIDVLPTKLSFGSHLILRSDKQNQVFSDGQRWALECPRGFVARPERFLTPEIVAGKILKFDQDNRSFLGGTIAFWNQKGQICLVDDALPARREEFKFLLSAFGGLTPQIKMQSNYSGFLTVSLDNRNYGAVWEKDGIFCKTLVFNFKQ